MIQFKNSTILISKNYSTVGLFVVVFIAEECYEDYSAIQNGSTAEILAELRS